MKKNGENHYVALIVDIHIAREPFTKMNELFRNERDWWGVSKGH